MNKKQQYYQRIGWCNKMSVNEIPNVTYTVVGNNIGYTITANEGYCIHLPTHAENEYTTIIIVPVSYDFSKIQVLLISSLPEGSEIHSDADNDHEIM